MSEKHILYSGQDSFDYGIPIALDDGGWMVFGSWNLQLITTHLSNGVYWESFDKSGQVKESLFRSHVEQKWNIGLTSVTAIDGNWLLTWSQYADGVKHRVIMQERIDDEGNRIGNAEVVNTHLNGSYFADDAKALSSGGWITSWHLRDSSDYLDHVQLFQLFDENGEKLGGEQKITSDFDPFFVDRGVEGFDTYYTEERESKATLVCQSFTALGAKDGDARDVVDLELQDVNSGYITQLGDGTMLLTAELGHEFTDEVQQVRVDATGHVVGKVQTVDTTTDAIRVEDTGTTVLSDGGWVTVWTEMTNGSDDGSIFMRRYDSEGHAIGNQHKISMAKHSLGSVPKVEALHDGGWIVTWDRYDLNDNTDAVCFQRFDKSGHPVEDNNPPDAQDMSIDVSQGSSYVFDPLDFQYSDLEGNGVGGIKITGFSGHGKITLGGDAIHAGDIISVKNFSKLEWQPPHDQIGQGLAKLNFQLVDDGGSKGASQNTDPTPNSIVFNVLHTTYGTASADTMTGGSSRQFLFGLEGRDTITGGNNNDHLDGGGGTDDLSGGNGDDIIIGGKANDVLTGGAGGDTFVFQGNFGYDDIRDFSAKDGDKIDLSHVPGVHNFDELLQLVDHSQDHPVIIFGYHREITVEMNRHEGLSAEDFIFTR